MTEIALPALSRTAGALRDAMRDIRGSWSRTATAVTAALVLGALVPIVAPGSFRLDGVAATLYLAVGAVGLSIALGLGGLPSLAQGAFVGVGALVSAHVRADLEWPPLAAAALGTLGALAAGVVAGIAFVRLRPAFVAVATWVLTWLFLVFVLAFPSISGGSQGLVVPQGDLAGISLGTTAHYELALVLLALAMLTALALSRSAIGSGLAAVRQRPAAASALGLSAARLRLVAFAAAATVGGLAGSFAVQLTGVFDGRSHGPFLSFSLFVAVLLGGSRAGIGAALGAFAFALIAWAAGKLGGLAGLGVGRLDALVASLLVLYALGLDTESLLPELLRRRRGRSLDARGRSRPAVTLGPIRPARLLATSLTKRFGTVDAVADLSLELEAGRVIALIGPNGSGKTTALRLLSGTLVPDEGSVRLDGAELPANPVSRTAAGVVRTLQATATFPGSTAAENVIAGAGVRRRYGGALRALFATPLARREAARTRARAETILAELGLAGKAETPASELPGVEQRILMIAAALATEPRVLLLDEPSAGAAAADLERLAALIRRLSDAGLAILLVEHNLRLVRSVADRVIVLDAGRSIAEGTPDEVATNEAVRAAYLGRRHL
jgi:ABC-type branched-subunit amino acid transport system ATPase component/ABC-type branched-subunit amino acid transport system permease subunit